MGYEFLAVRDESSDDGALYPVLGSAEDASCLIELEELDGPSVVQHPVKDIYVRRVEGSKLRYLKRVQDIKAVLYVTDARVALACEKFDKGGGWVGFSLSGMATAAAVNAVSKARASRRRKGKLLVAHVRYPWLGSIAFTAKGVGFLNSEEVSFRTQIVEDGTTKVLELTVHLGKGASAPAIANDVAQRCARYRLRHKHDLGDEDRLLLNQLLEAPPLAPEPKRVVRYLLGPYWKVSTKRAYPETSPSVPATPSPAVKPGPEPPSLAAEPDRHPGPPAAPETPPSPEPGRLEITLDDLD